MKVGQGSRQILTRKYRYNVFNNISKIDAHSTDRFAKNRMET